VRNPTPYRVDGEVGRYSFDTYRVEGDAGVVSFDTAEQVFTPLHGKQRYLTRGFKELAFAYGVVEGSYRKTAAWLNRVRHQADATPARTLQEVSEAEGGRARQALEARSEAALSAAEGAEALARARPEREGLLDGRSVAGARRRVEAGVALSEAQRRAIRVNPVPYEDRAQSTAVSIDDVGAKEQKAQRSLGPRRQREPGKRPMVQTTVAHIESARGRYALSGSSVAGVLRMVLAYVLANALLGGRLVVFLDGQKSLRLAVALALQATGRLQIILDWYHLEKRVAQELSEALNSRLYRNEVLKQVTHWLWYGLVDDAIASLQAVDPKRVKNARRIEVLVEALESRRAIIPCYALRKELGLRNSSNVGEKYNDLIVSERQKHNGMSWSADGSGALAALTTLVVNGEHHQWFRTGEIRFAPAA
jgi:hypothetical protein